jgi:hypothetical protein
VGDAANLAAVGGEASTRMTRAKIKGAVLAAVPLALFVLPPAMAHDPTAEELNVHELVRILSPTKPAAITAFGYGTAPRAQEVTNIRWNVIRRPSGEFYCISENLYLYAVHDSFDYFPLCAQQNIPGHPCAIFR